MTQDELLEHEFLDRTVIMTGIFEEYVGSHDCRIMFAEQISKVRESLSELEAEILDFNVRTPDDKNRLRERGEEMTIEEHRNNLLNQIVVLEDLISRETYKAKAAEARIQACETSILLMRQALANTHPSGLKIEEGRQ